ncbi:MAG: ABC transporter permease [Flammeovirgaceae bacterium]|jgi:putative ABC transport system permease protein|nr:ABC transporter permease [Flammeovirgaceae bacterium]
MLKKIINSFKMAVGTMHGNLFHTLLSILGMIIGVAALVSILSLIDGMEQYARDQISRTTSLKSIVISPRNTKTVNGISVKKDSFVYITYPKFRALRNAVTKPAQAYLISTQSAEVVAANQKIVSMVYGCSEKIKPSFTTQKGRIFSVEDFENNPGNAVINVAFVKAAKEKQNWLNEKLRIHQREVNVIGIIDDKSDRPEVYLPLTAFKDEALKAYPPSVAFDVENIEDVASVKETIRGWMKREYPNNLDDMELMTHEFRLEQATQGFMLFRVIMGLIVGISVIVGGIGVMNVMLISVTQRTTEIGVRKALGANRTDIVLQFLAEAVSISTLGSVCGLILGILGTMAIIPIVKAITKVPFQASYTWNTIGVVAVLAILVGVVFGTYPAMRASKLDPVEAIRRE